MEYAIFPYAAQELSGFKSCMARQKVVGYADNINEAKKIAYENDGGGAVFRMREPKMPEVAGGRQVWGDPIELKDLVWTCLVTVVVPETAGALAWLGNQETPTRETPERGPDSIT